jgi:hypothetical protein
VPLISLYHVFLGLIHFPSPASSLVFLSSLSIKMNDGENVTSDKHFGLINTSQRVLERNTTLDRKGEATVPYIGLLVVVV